MGGDCVVVGNNAVNCFGRIIPRVAALAFLRMGLAANIICFYLNFLEKAQHYIIVEGNLTNARYSHSQMTPIMGRGQGMGWAG